MTHRLTFLLLLPVILILSFTPSKQVTSLAVKKPAPAACASTFTVELRGCENAWFAIDYITVDGVRLDVNLGCHNYSGPTYVGAIALQNGPATVTIHASAGRMSWVDLYDHRGSWDGYVAGWASRTPAKTVSFTADLIGCGEDYTLMIIVKN